MDVSVSEPIVNRIKKLRMKSDQIESIKASQLMGDKISKKEQKLLHSKALVNARLDELVKLCQLLYPTLTEDLDLYENSESESENSESESEDSADEIFGNWFLSVKDIGLILKLVSRLQDSTFVEKVLEEAAIEFRQRHPCVQDPSLMTEKLKKIISRSDDRYSSREKIISGLSNFGFQRDSLKKISSRFDDYFARKLKADMEAERLGQLKAGGMKETDFKKQAEVDETIAHAHIETDTDVATETITSKGHVDRKWADVEVERLGQLKAGGMKETDFKKKAEVDETIAHPHIETDTDVATETITSKGHVDRKWVHGKQTTIYCRWKGQELYQINAIHLTNCRRESWISKFKLLEP